MPRRIASATKSLGSSLLGIHGAGTVASFIWFSYQYAREHGFLSWLLLGEVIPLLKACVWEVFVVLALVGSGSEFAADDMHYNSSREAFNLAARFVQHIRETEDRDLNSEETVEVCNYLRRALVEARKVSDDYLDAVHPEFKRRYKEHYLEVVRLMIIGYEAKDSLAWMKAMRLQREWVEWTAAHEEDLQWPQ